MNPLADFADYIQRDAAGHVKLFQEFKTELRLANSDWVALRKLEASEPVPQEWLDYRQALRDVPENTLDPAYPVWPNAPE